MTERREDCEHCFTTKKTQILCKENDERKANIKSANLRIDDLMKNKISTRLFFFAVAFLIGSVGMVAGMGIESKLDRAVTRSKLQQMQECQSELFQEIKDLINAFHTTP